MACIAILAVLSLAISQTLIQIFPSQSGSHFHWNLLGVVVSALTLGAILIKLKTHPKMLEVAYVWDLKQQLNRIYRKNRKLIAAAKQGNKGAMLALQFSYHGSRQLWELDDNTITINTLNKAQLELDGWAEQYNVELNINEYHSGLLSEF